MSNYSGAETRGARMMIVSADRESGGSWIDDSPSTVRYVLKMLREMQAEDPISDWKLEVRGDGCGWHKADMASLEAAVKCAV